MAEAFLIFLSAGIMLAAVISDPEQVTLLWLRLCGIIALAVGGLSMYFLLTRNAADSTTPVFFQRMQIGLTIATLALILGQLAFVQVAWRRTQRVLAGAAFVVGVLAGAGMLHDMMVTRGTYLNYPPKALGITLQMLAGVGIAGMCGLALMDMLLGHAYLTASKMTIAPFRRLNLALATIMVLRAISAIALALALQAWRRPEMMWNLYGLYIGTRWFVGLIVPAVFVYMAHDCITRRSTQSATGILYVAGVLIFIGEIVALYLMHETGLPF